MGRVASALTGCSWRRGERLGLSEGWDSTRVPLCGPLLSFWALDQVLTVVSGLALPTLALPNCMSPPSCARPWDHELTPSNPLLQHLPLFPSS